jgi:mycothiol system anti-sigma-R factor
MSCGKHHETPCTEVLDKVYLYLDGEIPTHDCDRIREHLEECGPCLRQYDLDQVVKKLVARSCGCDLASDDLRGRVLARIREVQVEIARDETVGITVRQVEVTRSDNRAD